MKRDLCEVRELTLPYDEIRAVLAPNPIRFLQPAAEAGLHHAGEVLTTLEVDIVGVHLERQVIVAVGPIREIPPPASLLRIPVWWHAVDDSGRYPMMDGVFEAYPMTERVTRVSLQGSYIPPLGSLGATLDRLVLRRIAEDSVAHLMDDIAYRIVAMWTEQFGPGVAAV